MLTAVSTEALPLDRRQRRRLETIEEVLDVALEVMTEQGVAGLSVGEVARRMGIRPPSLYVYFPSKHALYDALFQRGAAAVRDVIESSVRVDPKRSLATTLQEAAELLVRWAIDNPAYTQMLFWRPVPGFEPSAAAYAASVEMSEFSIHQFRALQDLGLLRSDVPAQDIFRDWTILCSGVISQQLANGPDDTFESGAFTRALPSIVAMFATYYGATANPPSSPRTQKERSRERTR